MKRLLTGLGAAAIAGLIGLGATTAQAAPLQQGVETSGVTAAYAQYVERRVIRRGPGGRVVERRVIRPRREICRVQVVRRITPRGVVVERIRRCR